MRSVILVIGILVVLCRSGRALLVTDDLQFTSNLTCSGIGSSCYCQPYGPSPRQRYTLQLSLSLPPRSETPTLLPLLIFFHGDGGRYLLKTGDYTPYAEAATAAGFAFLEYNVGSGGGLMAGVTDAIELQFLPSLVEWAQRTSDAPGSPATGRLDLNRIAVAGHSRGGQPHIYAAFLIDPVDCPCFAPCQSNCYPSAVAAIQAANKPLAVAGAGIRGCCNPHTGGFCTFACQAACYAASGNGTCIGNDYQDFLSAAGSGSQSSTQAAGHAQFAAIQSGPLRVLANAFCGSNASTTDEVVSTEAAAKMVAWLKRRTFPVKS